MNTNQIKAIRETFKGKPVVITIILDNSQNFYMNRKGQVILWDDVKEIVTCIRENNQANQQINPFEITVSAYEHIQYMRVAVDIDGVEEYLKGISYSKKDELINYLLNNPVIQSSITTPAVGGLDWSKAPSKAVTVEGSTDGKKYEGSGSSSSSGGSSGSDGDVDDDI